MIMMMMTMMYKTDYCTDASMQVWSYAPLHQQLKRQLTGGRDDDMVDHPIALSQSVSPGGGFGGDVEDDVAADAIDDTSSEVASATSTTSPSKKASTSIISTTTSNSKAKSKPRLLKGGGTYIIICRSTTCYIITPVDR